MLLSSQRQNEIESGRRADDMESEADDSHTPIKFIMDFGNRIATFNVMIFSWNTFEEGIQMGKDELNQLRIPFESDDCLA